MYRLLFLWFSVVSAELEMVQVLVRHGDRAPSFTYPLDDTFNVTKHFPRGFSQLTRQGFEQSNRLGAVLRDTYGDFVGQFDRKETLIRSSDKDRCIETAMGITQTLFPAEIVPIHTFSHYKQDLLLKPNSVPCRRVEEIVKHDKSTLAASMSVEHQALFHFLSQKTGWAVDVFNVADVFNVLHRKRANGISQPEWVDHVLANVTELKRQLRTSEFNSEEKAKLRTGYLLGQVSQDMWNRAASGTGKKLIVYATHDATITSLMYSLGISDHQLVPYTAALIVEMHKVAGRRYVKLIYRVPGESPRLKRVPGCEQLCPMEHFNRYVTPRIVSSRDQFEVDCQNLDS